MKVSRMIACIVFLLSNISALAQSVTPKPVKPAVVSPLTSLQASIKGTFWRDEKWIGLLSLTPEQQSRMNEIFHQHRLKLVDLTAVLEKEELILEPLLGSGRPAPDAEPKIQTQIDRIADARSELEKANSRMLLGILQVLTTEQWSKLPVVTRAKKEVVVGLLPKKLK